MQLFSLYSENNEWGYFHCKVIVIKKIFVMGFELASVSTLGLLPNALTTTPRLQT